MFYSSGAAEFFSNIKYHQEFSSYNNFTVRVHHPRVLSSAREDNWNVDLKTDIPFNQHAKNLKEKGENLKSPKATKQQLTRSYHLI